MLEEELGCHRITVAKEWLQDKIEAGVVHSYSDGDILNMLRAEVGIQCYSMYLTFLKTSCDIYEKGYFEQKYGVDHNVGRNDNAGKIPS